MFVFLATPLWAGFLKSDTIITCMSGNGKSGTGKLKVVCFDTLWEKSGIYEGGCKNGLPHGRGSIPDCTACRRGKSGPI